ncbi:MAG: hypothetical protein KatS3mg068_0659 [Candidatus Sericytochromatia bacterium]|nr:MAG: hypothetical protein KatS3mg068_0659 [Candidatus Sericytochromatia bacterium]
MKIFFLFLTIILNSCFFSKNSANNFYQQEIINNFELINSNNYIIKAKKAVILNDNYYLYNTNIYFQDIKFYSDKVDIINNNIFLLKKLIIESKSFSIISQKSKYKDKIFKLEKVKAKF